MGPLDNVSQHAANIVGETPGMAIPVGASQGMSPIIELLMSILGQAQQQQPRPSTTSQQTSPYMGPRANPVTGQPEEKKLKGQIMGQPPQY